MNEDDHAPSFETLRRLAESLPGMAKGLKQGTIGGKGLKQLPTKSCDVCGRGFDPAWQQSLEIGQLESGICSDCDRQLKEGMVAVKDGTTYAFFNPPPSLKDWSGQVVTVTPKVMIEIKARMADQKVRKNGH